MAQALLDGLVAEAGVQIVSAAELDGFLAARSGKLTVLFFTGDPEKKAETADVAVVLRELLRIAGGRLEAALIARADELTLMARCSVKMLPSLAFYAGPEHLKTIPKIQDWSDYAEKLPKLLAAAEAEVLIDA